MHLRSGGVGFLKLKKFALSLWAVSIKVMSLKLKKICFIIMGSKH